jgi:hypothetical protein
LETDPLGLAPGPPPLGSLLLLPSTHLTGRSSPPADWLGLQTQSPAPLDVGLEPLAQSRRAPRQGDSPRIRPPAPLRRRSRTHAGVPISEDHQNEPLVSAPLLFRRSHEHDVSTRDCPARTGAGARIEEFGMNAELRLALGPYGSAHTHRCAKNAPCTSCPPFDACRSLTARLIEKAPNSIVYSS